MEAESTTSQKALVREGENPFQDEVYVSPDVAAAMRGERVDFSQHLGVEPDPPEAPEEEVTETQFSDDPA